MKTDRESFRQNLARRTLHGAKWNYLGVVARIAMQLAAQIVLARFIGPSEFGYYSLAFVTVGIAALLSEFGLSAALVQSKDLTDSDVRRVWSYLLVSSMLAAVTMVTLAEPIARLMGLPEAADHLRLAAIPLVIQLLSSVALALLRKNLDFKRIQFAQVAGMLVGQVGVGFLLAWLLHSAWAILIGWTIQLALAWILMYLKVRHRLKPSFALIGKDLSRFGFGAWTANLANWGIENLHMILAGKLFGATTLGLYSVSSNLVRYPTNHLVATLQAVLFPASAQAQEDHEVLHTAYLAVLALVALVTVPLFIAAAILAEPLILLLYGPDWRGAAELMQPLALAMPLHSVTAVSGPILWGIGRVRRESALQWLTIVCFLLLAYIIGLPSPVTLAWIVLAIYALRACLLSGAVASILDISLWRVISVLRGAFVLGAISGAGATSAHYLLGSTSPGGSIASAVIIVVTASLSVLWIWPAAIISPPLARVIQQFGSRLPASFLARIRQTRA